MKNNKKDISVYSLLSESIQNDILISNQNNYYLISYLKKSDKYVLIINYDKNKNFEEQDIICEILDKKHFIDYLKDLKIVEINSEIYNNLIYQESIYFLDKVLNEIGSIKIFDNINIRHYTIENKENFILDKKNINVKKPFQLSNEVDEININIENLLTTLYMLTMEYREEYPYTENEINKLKNIETTDSKQLNSLNRKEALISIINGSLLKNENIQNKYFYFNEKTGLIELYNIIDEENNIYELINDNQNEIWKYISENEKEWNLFEKPIYEYQFLYFENGFYKTTSKYYENTEDAISDTKINNLKIIEESKKRKI